MRCQFAGHLAAKLSARVMKKSFFLILFIVNFLTSRAEHITGGEMFYTYNGTSGNLHSYTVTLKLFMRCGSGRQFPDPAIITVFSRDVNFVIRDIRPSKTREETISLANDNPCITNPPTVCYVVAYYTFEVLLPESELGYVLASEVNYRIRGITNIGNSQVGATYTCEIPGNASVANAPANNSANFVGSDLVVICTDNSFSYSFNAVDPDNDELHYYFSSGYATTATSNSTYGTPPFPELPYTSFYSPTMPLGVNVTIDPATGLITGTGPESGIFVVTVSVDEIRNGVVIATQRKDLQINVADCNVAAASLKDYMLCGTTRTASLFNMSTSPLIISNDWIIYDPAGTVIHSFRGNNLVYTFPVNGVYKVKLILNQGQECTDSTTVNVFVFPGLTPDFEFSNICINRPTLFTDRSTNTSGTINSWQWDFGESIITTTSSLQNTNYTYLTEGTRNVRLIVGTPDGCRDTITKAVPIINKPPIGLAFHDTLICVNDVLPLLATGAGNFTWSPSQNMINPNSSSPIVSPVITTTYYVNMDAGGCTNNDSVLVRVVDHVTIRAMNDTTICSSDTIRLRINSDGLHYTWTPASQLINPLVKDPFAITAVNTLYRVNAVIGGCSANSQVQVTTVPYPLANAGADTVICYDTRADLHATTDGSSWQWSPLQSLTGGASLNPIAFPPRSTNYVFTAFDTKGCPKPGRDTVFVKVLADLNAYAGRDTVAVLGQPLQLNASESYKYQWSPATYLSATDIPNPVARFTAPSDNFRYKLKITNESGCSDSAYVKVKVFATNPTVFVPTGFTPNNDGKNDVLRVTAVGMQHIEYFNIYNRWGQLIFSTTNNDRGWNGTINGQQQANNTYVWMVKAIDFTGAPYFQKGVVTLIR